MLFLNTDFITPNVLKENFRLNYLSINEFKFLALAYILINLIHWSLAILKFLSFIILLYCLLISFYQFILCLLIYQVGVLQP